jgi:hypothetical protein
VGVKQGDVFEYDMSSSFSSTLTSTLPAELVELNQTEWIRVTVTGVSGSQISTQVTTHYRNGTVLLTFSEFACFLVLVSDKWARGYSGCFLI